MAKHKYFKQSEFSCKCGCGFCEPYDELLETCDIIREAIGVPLVVSSGCRCEKHNKKVGGVPNSNHTKGWAADLVPQGKTPDKLWKTIIALHEAKALKWLAGVGRYDTFVHIDIGPKRVDGRLRQWDERKRL